MYSLMMINLQNSFSFFGSFSSLSHATFFSVSDLSQLQIFHRHRTGTSVMLKVKTNEMEQGRLNYLTSSV